MKLRIHLIASCILASLLGLHPKQTIAAKSPSSAPDASMEHLKQVLVSYTWSWVDPRPNFWTEIHFNQDGSLTAWIGSRLVDTRRWEVTGPQTAQMTGRGQDLRMRVFTFDDTLTKYVAQVFDRKGSDATFQITGNRLAPVANLVLPATQPTPAVASAPKAAATPTSAGPVANLPLGPMPSPVRPISPPTPLDPIVGRWRVDQTIIVFAQDGSFENSAPHYFEKGKWSLATSSKPPTYQLNWSGGRKIEDFQLLGDGLKRRDQRKGWVAAGQRVD